MQNSKHKRSVRALTLASAITLFLPNLTSAQVLGSWSQGVMPYLSAPSDADITFGVVAPARIYNATEALRWGLDFIIAPSRASDRSLMYGYRMRGLRKASLEGLLQQETLISGKILIAVVNEASFGPVPLLGKEKAYLAAPVLAVSARLRNLDSFSDAKYADFVKIAPALVGFSSLKAAGVDIYDKYVISDLMSDAVPFVATNKPITDTKVDQYFIVSDSSWKFEENSSDSTWGIRFSK